MYDYELLCKKLLKFIKNEILNKIIECDDCYYYDVCKLLQITKTLKQMTDIEIDDIITNKKINFDDISTIEYITIFNRFINLLSCPNNIIICDSEDFNCLECWSKFINNL